MSEEERRVPIDLTRHGVEFAPWETPVQNDHLCLGPLVYRPIYPILTSDHEFDLAGGADEPFNALEATFLSLDKCRLFRFTFSAITAFRVLDENGLTELWQASAARPRPAHSTFRVRGHGWADESFLVFLDGDSERGRYSYMVATEDLCLEVVSPTAPVVTDIGRPRFREL